MRRPVCPAVPALLVAALLGACSGDGGASAPTTSAPSGPEPAVAEIVLRGDGLGVVDLGSPPDAAIEAVTASLGAPTADTGWEPSASAYGTCPGEQIRGVEWDHLVLLFTDGDTDYGHGEHLFTWRITGAPPALGTATGLGYQARVADAEELYPDAVEVTAPEDPFPGFLTIAAEGGEITAYLDGDVITNLEAGAGCGE